MRASTMINSIQHNTRAYELKLRDIERQLSEASVHELEMEREIATQLTAIAGMHVDNRVALENDALRELELRRVEEQSLRDRLARLESGIESLLTQVDAERKQIEEAEIRAHGLLAADAKFNVVAKQYASALQAHEKAEKSARDILDECKRKLPPYQQEPLYRYLISSHYGTDRYQRGGVLRLLDRWIAKLCNFEQNRKNELSLIAMQAALNGAADERQQRVDALRVEVDTLRAAAAQAVGQHEMRQRLEKLEAQVQHEKHRANAIHEQLAIYVENRDLHYLRAREIVADALESHSAEELLARVEQTPDVSDDAIARKVIQLRTALRNCRGRAAELHVQKMDANKDYENAKALERRLTDNRYIGSGYQYRSGLDLGSLIGGYMLGHLTADAAAHALGQYRTEIDPPIYGGLAGSEGDFGGLSSESVFSSSDWSGGGSFDTSDSF